MRSHFESRSMAYAYQPIITPRGEVLHEHKLDTRMESSDLVLLDVGGEMPSGYAADVTRTWPVNQRMSKTQRMIYQIVERAHKVAVDAVAPGVEYAEIHALAARELVVGLVDVGILLGDPESLFAQNIHTAFFPHGVGHLLGLDVHDMEDLGDLAGYTPGRARRQAFGWSFLRLDRQLKENYGGHGEPGFYTDRRIADAIPCPSSAPAMHRLGGLGAILEMSEGSVSKTTYSSRRRGGTF